MTSETRGFDDLSDEEKLVFARAQLGHGRDKVDSLINDLTSSKLKRVLKLVSHIHLADAHLGVNSNFNLSEEEKVLVDTIFALQEDVMGYEVLASEINKKQQEDGQVDLETSLETTNE